MSDDVVVNTAKFAETNPASTELWTPPEKLSANVGKMAWALFMECWKTTLAKSGEVLSPTLATEFYRECIGVAKALEEVNQDPSKKPDELRETG